MSERGFPVVRFPDDPAWDEAADAVTFPVEAGEYQGTVFVARRALQGLLGHTPKPEEAVEAVYVNRTAFERAAEQRILDRRLDEDANIHLTARDLHRANR
jgi:hypothetical protein